jgi:hypothetical protein
MSETNAKNEVLIQPTPIPIGETCGTALYTIKSFPSNRPLKSGLMINGKMYSYVGTSQTFILPIFRMLSDAEVNEMFTTGPIRVTKEPTRSHPKQSVDRKPKTQREHG